jgi:glycosyltransferase involved in cell wall biosynthesis
MGGGGAERVAATLAGGWAARGWRVFIVPTFLGDSSAAYELHADVTVAPLSQALRSGRGNKIVALRRHVRALAPDVVISFLTNVNVTAILALRGSGIPLVLSERVDIAASVEMSWALRLARKALYRYADALVLQTTQAIAAYRRALWRPPRIYTIANPLPDALHASGLRADPTPAGGGGRVIAIGRLTAQKRFDLLIRAFNRAFAADPRWSLEIYGEGPLRESLEALARQLNAGSSVRLPGTTPDPWGALARAQIFALSSAYEGFPNAMLEAMAVGLACIAFDCPTGPRELADSGAAVLVPPADVDLLASAMRRVAEDPTERVRLGRAAAESVRRRFALADVLSRWDELFASLRLPTRT